MDTCLELIALNGFLQGYTLQSLGCVSRHLHQSLKPFVRQAVACKVIVQAFQQARWRSSLSFSMFYYLYYPRDHVAGMIRLISWKSLDPRIRQYAARLIESNKPLRKFHLATLISLMSERDVAFVGW